MLVNIIFQGILILAIVSVITRILLLVLIKPVKMKWNNKNYQFEIDPLIDENKFRNETNILFENLNNNLNYIDSYVISKINNSRTFIAKYNNVDENHEYQIFCYNKKLELLKVINVNENTNSFNSKRIELPNKTNFVNLVESELGINFSKVRNSRLYNLYTILDFTIVFSLSFLVFYLFNMIYSKFLSYPYLVNRGLFLMLFFSTLIALISIKLSSINRNRNKAVRKEVSYE